MKTKGLIFVSCLAAGALIASPAMGKPAKKSSMSKSKRMAPQTTQVMRNYRHNQNISPRTGSTRYYGGTRYSGTRSYAGGNMPGRVTTAAHAIMATIMGAAPAITMGVELTRTTATTRAGRPRIGVTARTRDITRIVSRRLSVQWLQQLLLYYTPTYGYNASMVAAVQRRLGQLGYYHGVVDGVIGPQTRGAIAAFESRNGLAVDGTISRPLLDTFGASLVGTNNQVFDRRRRTTKGASRRSFLFHNNQQMHQAEPAFFLMSQKK